MGGLKAFGLVLQVSTHFATHSHDSVEVSNDGLPQNQGKIPPSRMTTWMGNHSTKIEPIWHDLFQ